MNDNELDNLIKNIYSKKINEPPEFEMAIRNAFKDKKKLLIKQKIMKLASVICSFVVMLSGIVYAKDIEKYFKNLFTNTTESIDSAVENGYFQNIDMDFVYDNDIGIKADNLVLDDLNLDISFCFKTNNPNIESIKFKDFIIKNDNDKKIYESEIQNVDLIEDVSLFTSLNWSNKPVKLSDTIFTDSILFGIKQEKERFNELYFDIKSLSLTYIDGRIENLQGNWKFNIILDDKMKKSDEIYYTILEENEFVESCTGTLSATGMIIELYLNSDFDEQLINSGEDIFVLENNNDTFSFDMCREDVIESKTRFILTYNNIGKFMGNNDKFQLHIKPYNTTIILNKQK